MPDTDFSFDIDESEAVEDLGGLRRSGDMTSEDMTGGEVAEKSTVVMVWDSDDDLFVDLNDNLVGANKKETSQALAEQPQTHAQPQQPQAQADSQTTRICHKCEKCGKTYVRAQLYMKHVSACTKTRQVKKERVSQHQWASKFKFLCSDHEVVNYLLNKYDL